MGNYPLLFELTLRMVNIHHFLFDTLMVNIWNSPFEITLRTVKISKSFFSPVSLQIQVQIAYARLPYTHTCTFTYTPFLHAPCLLCFCDVCVSGPKLYVETKCVVSLNFWTTHFNKHSQKRGNCRDRILSPLQLESPVPMTKILIFIYMITILCWE